MSDKIDSQSENLFCFVEYKPQDAESVSTVKYSYWGAVFYNFVRKKATIVMLILFSLLFLLSIIISGMYGVNYSELPIDLNKAFVLPCREHLFGTDNLGRDYWIQVWYACGTSIKLSFLVATGEIILGVVMGLIWGYVPESDTVFTAIYNIFDNIPEILVLTLVSLFFGKGFFVMAVALIAFGWLRMAIEVRNMVIIYRDREYNLASRCLGTPIYRILIKNILPYLVSVIVLRMSLSIPTTIALESTLSFLGLGLDVNTPSLGVLLSNARMYFMDYSYLLLFPAVIVAIISVTFYLLGNSLADATDPKNHR